MHDVAVQFATMGMNIVAYDPLVLLQELRNAVVVKVVESIAVHGAHLPQGTTVRDAPPFVAKAVQDQLAIASKHMLQTFTLNTIAPMEDTMTAAFSEITFVNMDAADLGPPRPWVRQMCQVLLDVATEASGLLPAGDPLPAALVWALLAAYLGSCPDCVVRTAAA